MFYIQDVLKLKNNSDAKRLNPLQHLQDKLLERCRHLKLYVPVTVADIINCWCCVYESSYVLWAKLSYLQCSERKDSLWVTVGMNTCEVNGQLYGKDSQWMYNVTFRRVHATIVAVEKQWMLHNLSGVYSLRYPTCAILSSVVCPDL